jgi:hypothetical protein
MSWGRSGIIWDFFLDSSIKSRLLIFAQVKLLIKNISIVITNNFHSIFGLL